ncbi:MAG: hypothetical protein MUF15_19335 [Acidobacteria bacterium]|nr:hypothetical protein [Acidobacteriota bacterium]
METFFQLKGFTVLLELLLKSLVILSLALGFYFFARKQPASVRHFVLGISMLSLLVLPFLSVFMPGWQTNLLPSWTTATGESETVTIVQFSASSLTNPEVKHLYKFQGHLSAGDQASGIYRFLQPQFRIGLITLWLLVCSFMLVKILFGLYGAFRLTRQGISMKGYPSRRILLCVEYGM